MAAQVLTACLLAISAAALTPLRAQTTSLPTPPEIASVDDWGVDLLAGEYRASDSFLSIGNGVRGLSHSRSWMKDPQNSGTNGFLHNYIISIYNSGGVPVVTLGARSISFKNAAQIYDQVGNVVGYTYNTGNNDGIVLTSHFYPTKFYTIDTYKLTEKDGTIINFSNPFISNSSIYFGFYLSAHAVADSIVHPNGQIETLTYKPGNYRVYNCPGGTTTCGTYTTYQNLRLQSVATNSGYMLHFSHGSDAIAFGNVAAADEWMRIAKAQVINLAQNYCDPAGDSCATDNGSVSYSQSYSGSIASGSYGYQYATLPDGRSKYYKINSENRITAIQNIGSTTEDTQITRTWWGSCVGSNCTFSRVFFTIIMNGYGQHIYDFHFNSAGQLNTVDSNSQDYVQYHRTVSIGWYNINGSNAKICGISNDTLSGNIISHNNNMVYHNLNYAYDQYCRISTAGDSTTWTKFAHDDRGNVTSATIKSQYSGSTIVASANYAATCANPITCNKPLTITDNAGKVSTFTYDPVHGGVLTATAPAAAAGGVQPQLRTTYAQFTAYYKNAAGSIVAAPSAIYLPNGTSTCITTASCSGTADEVTTSVSYGAIGVANNLLPVATTTAAGNGSISSTTTASYDAVGNKISEDGPLPGGADVTSWIYTVDRQVTQVVGPDPDGAGPLHNRSVKTTYDVRGQPTSVDSGTSNADGGGFVSLARVDSAYDSYFRKTYDISYGGGTAQARTDYSYDALGRVDCAATRMNPALFAPTNSTAACSLGAQGSFGPDRITRYSYNIDHVIQQISGYGTSVQRTDFSKYYDSLGRLTSYTDGKGNVTGYAYDWFDRLQKTSYPSPTTVGQLSSTDFEQLTYDANGRLATRQLRDGKQISYSYDDLGRQTLAHMVNPVDANDRDIATSYDLLGRVTQVDDGAGRKVGFAYDALGRKLSESPQLTGGSVSYQYDVAGRRIRTTWPDGFFVTYDYDTLGELLAIRENDVTSGPGILAAYSYDDRGKALSLTRGNGVNQNFGYDVLGRLSTVAISHATAGNSYTFAYNPAGQLASRSMTNDAYAWTQAAAVNRAYTVNGLNQYTASGAIVPTYDLRGNMTSAGATAYVYDSKNHLTNFGTNSFGYDAVGRLVSQATPATRFVYDGSDIIAETDGSNNILRRYVHIPGTDNVVTWYEGSGTSDRRWLAHDERGSVTLITNPTGTALAINSYDDYGIPASTNLGRFQYTGQTWMPELGMYNYKARIYSPTMGRFMQTDPTGYDDGPNWYNYVKGDPINGADPSGNCGVAGSAPTQQEIGCYIAEAAYNGMRTSNLMGQQSSLAQSLLIGQEESAAAGQQTWAAGPQMAEIAQYHADERAARIFIDNALKGGADGFQLTASGLPPGSYHRPAIGPNPLDPQFINKPITEYELTRINNTMNLLMNGDTIQVMNTLNAHYFQNIPDPITGARLPYDSRGYTAIDVLDYGRGGSNRILLSNTPPTQMYYTNTHYSSFYWMGH